MKKKTQRWLSIVLSLVLILQLVPTQVFAREAEIVAGEKAALPQADPRLAETEPGANSSANTNNDDDTAEIVAEIPEGRDEFQKEFLLSNGLRLISVYGNAVHYEEDGEWKEIDNTLQPVSATGTVLTGKAALTNAVAYKNTAGIWDVSLPTGLNTNTPVSVSRDGYTLSFRFSGALHNNHVVMGIGGDSAVASLVGEPSAEVLGLSDTDSTVQIGEMATPLQTSAAQLITATDSVAMDEILYKETALTKLNTALMYEDIYDNTDLRYDLTSHTLKESVIINAPSETLAGYSYALTTDGLVLELQDDNSILAYAADGEEGDEPIFIMPAPYLVDTERAYSDDITVSLIGSEGNYTLTYRLPRQWMAAEERVYPVTLDPIVEATSHTNSIEDQSVFQYNQFGYLWEYLEVGYDPGYGNERIFIKFTDLPKLDSADVIVEAVMGLYKRHSNNPVTMEAHEVLGPWSSSTINWSNMPATNPLVEDYQQVGAAVGYYWNITNMVQNWYESNNGVMFCISDVEDGSSANYHQFYSSDAYSNLPSLLIKYLNNSGLEDYWDYTSQSAGLSGTGYINNFTGNLVWVHNGLSFSGTRMPVAISHVYNANDKDNNNFGLGFGWRTNYNQLVYQWTEDNDYYVWEDQDGTLRYFYHDSGSTYKNETDSTLILRTDGSGDEKYWIEDKNGNKSYFDTNGRLKKIVNNQETPSIITLTYTSDSAYLISTITDGSGETNTSNRTATGGRKYEFHYTNGLLSYINYMGSGNKPIATSIYAHDTDNKNLVAITNLDGTYAVFCYNQEHQNTLRDTCENGCGNSGLEKHLLHRVFDVDGYCVDYNYTESAPYRVTNVTEYDGSAQGGYLNIEYAHNQTTLTDHTGNKEIVQFNNYGSTVAIQDNLGRAQFAQYVGQNNAKNASQMTLSSKLQNTVVNLARNGSFEWTGFWQAASGNASTGSWAYDDSVTYLEWKAMRITRTADSTAYSVRSTSDASCPIQPGKSYTLSAYVKTTGMDGGGNGAMIGLQLGSSGAMVAVSEAKLTNSDWSRLEVTYSHPANASSDTLAIYLMNQSVGTAYFDCVQLEQSASASRYNIMENGDFRHGDAATTDSFGWHEGDDCGDDENREPLADNAATPQMDNYVYTMTGEATAQKRSYQNILISGSAGDVYTLAGWGKGDGVPMPTGSGRQFGLIFRFYYSDGTQEDIVISFNPDCDSTNSWQYVAGRAVAKRAYTSIRILLAYEYNQNTAHFDGIQLFKEEFGQSYAYDGNGNITSVIDLQKQTTSYEYSNNNLTKMVLPSGAEQKYTYDSYHNVLTATTPENVVATFTYDTYGNNLSVSVGSGTQKITAKAEYTTDGNYLTKIIDPLGNDTEYSYNTQTGVLNSVKSSGETVATTYTYDELYRTTKVAKGSADVTYAYETNLLDSIQSASDTVYDFDYGVFDLVDSVKIGSRTLISHQYSNDRNRYLTQSTYGNGDYIKYSYDAYGRTTSKTYEDNDKVSYAYDNNGNLGLVTDSATGRTTKYAYDFQDRLSRYEELGSGYSNRVTWTYDSKNNLQSQTQILNGTTYTTNYTYDNDNRIKSSTQDSVTSEYTYDALGRMTAVTGKNSGSPVVSTSIGYATPANNADTTSTTSSQVSSWANTVGSSYTYQYDPRGNITKIYSNGTLVAEYTYDGLDQLTVEKNYLVNKRWEYTYYDGGNIKTKTEFSPVTATSGATKSYSYDTTWKDLLTNYNGHALGYDGVGNLTSDGTWTYTWEHGRQLAGMTKSGTTISYTYNADGMRISKNVNGTVYHYHYLGDQLVQMTWGSNKMAFIYDVIGPSALIYNGTTYYYTRNAQGDVTGIVNTLGDTVADYHYDAWGNHQTVSGAVTSTVGNLNPLRYRGYVYDTETGLYYLQSRYYNPSWGRFINTDSYAVTDSESVLGVNSFAYCENNPVNHRDSEGTFLNTLIGGVVGGITAYRQWKQEQRSNPGASKETWKQAVTRGAVTGAAAGLALDISIATAGTGALAIALLGGAIASGGNTYWRQYNNEEAIDFVEIGIDAAIGGGMNMLFGAYGRTPHRATGSSIKEIGSAVTQNFKRSFSAPAGQWLPGKHARTWSLGFAEAFTASDFGGVFSGIFKQWVMFPE